MVVACQSADGRAGGHTTPPPPEVHVSTAQGNLVFQVEIAKTPQARAQGLMGRANLPPSQGMLFLFPKTEIQHFWMRNTLIPLDMVFIDEAFKVVGVVEKAEPLTEVARSVEKPSRYILEVNGGFAARYGIGVGTTVRFENVDLRHIE